MLKAAIGAAGLVLLASCSTMSPPISPAVRSELAPTGKRAGINYGNVILATRDSSSGELRGVHVDLAHELACAASRSPP